MINNSDMRYNGIFPNYSWTNKATGSENMSGIYFTLTSRPDGYYLSSLTMFS